MVLSRHFEMTKESMMNRLFVTTAVALFLGLSPVLAENQAPLDQPLPQPSAQPSPSAANAPAMNAPDQSSQAQPDQAMSPDHAMSSYRASESSQAIQRSDAQAIGRSASGAQSAQFLNEQKPDDWLASKLIGESVVNSQNEKIGDINDLVTDSQGRIVAALIGVGGFLGIGEKDVAVPFENLKLVRDADDNDDVTVVLNTNKETLASTPDYKTLDEQEVVQGSVKTPPSDGSRTY
jgi:sporulation protein YlmC with PRC-barrel domain